MAVNNENVGTVAVGIHDAYVKRGYDLALELGQSARAVVIQGASVRYIPLERTQVSGKEAVGATDHGKCHRWVGGRAISTGGGHRGGQRCRTTIRDRHGRRP